MKLTGKCKEDFQEWRRKQNYDVDAPFFYELNYSMQYGVYVDFFDSVGIYIDISFYELNSGIIEFDYTIGALNVLDIYGDDFKRRPEARTAAIEKANEIYNYERMYNIEEIENSLIAKIDVELKKWIKDDL
tara:strand:+ start:95 stop:487 length:393 start_codon:yes stop_codon:yes gene_type:complete